MAFVDIFLLYSVLRAFPEAYAERGQMVEAEERDARLDTPILICQLGFPGMPTFLHFFEPRLAPLLPSLSSARLIVGPAGIDSCSGDAWRPPIRASG